MRDRDDIVEKTSADVAGHVPEVQADEDADDVATDRKPHAPRNPDRPPAGDPAEWLVEIHGANLGAVRRLSHGVHILGRGIDCDVVIDTTAASRRHAAIDSRPGDVRIRDLGSTNGTQVNDVPVDDTQLLCHGDYVHVGGAIFKFLSGCDIEAAYHEEMYRLTIQDSLTRLHNRGHLVATMELEVRRARRYGRPLSLVMLDVDHFKRVNDENGHLVGDHVLRELATILVERARATDVVTRFGGEEFAVLMPETTSVGAREFAEAVRHIVELREFRAYGVSLHVTVSAGVAELTRQTTSEDALTLAADENLYLAKSTGRNRVIG